MAAAKTPSNIPWTQVFDVLSTQKNVGTLAKLSGVSKGARSVASQVQNGLANLALRTATVFTDDVSPPTSKQFEVMAKFQKIAAKAMQKMRAFHQDGAWVGTTPDLMAFIMAEHRFNGLEHKSSDGVYHDSNVTLELFSGLPASWTEWRAVSPRDIADYVRSHYAAHGENGKHPAHYETKFLLGLKALSMKLARHTGPLPAGASEFAQAISLGTLRGLAGHGYDLMIMAEVLDGGRVYDDLTRYATEACALAHKVSLEVLTTRPSPGKMDLAAAAVRSKDPALRAAGMAMKAAKPSDGLVQEARRKLSAAIAAGLGVAAKKNDEFDVLRVMHLACAFVYSAYRNRELYSKLAALDTFPPRGLDRQTPFESANIFLSQRYFKYPYYGNNIAPGLFAAFDFKSSWRNLKERALKLANAIWANGHDLHIYADMFEGLRPLIFNGPEAPMKFFRNNKWTYTEDDWHTRPDTLKYLYAQDLMDEIKLFFCVLEDISQSYGTQVESPFKNGDWPSTRESHEPLPSKLTAYMELNKHIQRYQQQHALPKKN